MNFIEKHDACVVVASEAWNVAHDAVDPYSHQRDTEASEFDLIRWNKYGYTKHVCTCGFTARTAQGLGLHRAAVRKRALKAADAAWEQAYDAKMEALNAEPKPEPTEADLNRLYGN